MDFHAYGCVVSVAGFIYGGIGYGLSILTCIFGTAIHRFFPEFASPPAPKLYRERRTTQELTLKTRRSRSCTKETASRPSATENLEVRYTFDSGSTASKLSVDNIHHNLRRVSSLESLDHHRSFVTVAPVITINHVDRKKKTEDNNNTDKSRQSFTLAHPPSLPNLPRRQPSPPAQPSRAGSAFRLANLKASWGHEKPKIHRSASSPHLMEFAKEDKGVFKDLCEEKLPSVLSKKGSKKPLKQDKRPSSAHSQTSSAKFFSSFPKNVEKKRSQTLTRTHPYDAPYFVALPIPPIPPMPSDEELRVKQTKRHKTLPPERTEEKRQRSSTSPQRISFFKTSKS
ncbi:hypothetical protein NP233_g3239 [Leucocoprinus birnbaumii]|uniref:Uncharacterized protein n=1 Tax=Leucocoprinus birnbaumii TaxID=56174 RepID=A0AAD5VXE7_9AGAR|nr:hypothetical protein NP233_g3239 [Leucocoprinus birnbaumii]